MLLGRHLWGRDRRRDHDDIPGLIAKAERVVHDPRERPDKLLSRLMRSGYWNRQQHQIDFHLADVFGCLFDLDQALALRGPTGHIHRCRWIDVFNNLFDGSVKRRHRQHANRFAGRKPGDRPGDTRLRRADRLQIGLAAGDRQCNRRGKPFVAIHVGVELVA